MGYKSHQIFFKLEKLFMPVNQKREHAINDPSLNELENYTLAYYINVQRGTIYIRWD